MSDLYRVDNAQMTYHGATYRLAWASLLADEVVVSVEPDAFVHVKNGKIAVHEGHVPDGYYTMFRETVEWADNE